MDAADAYMSELIFIMCAIEKSKLLFTLEPVSLRLLAYQSWGDDMEGALTTREDRTGLDQGCNCMHVAPLHWLEEAVKTGHL